MKQSRLPLLSFGFVFLLVASGFSQEQLPSPLYQEGEYWQFKYRSWGWPRLSYDSRRLIDGVYEIIYSQGQFKTFYFSPNGKQELSPPNPKLMYLLDPGRDFQFPLAVGKAWSYEYQQLKDLGIKPNITAQTWYRTVKLNVERVEKVNTDAGTFNTFRVVKVDRRNTTSLGTAATTYNFSPQTRSIVRLRGIELVETAGPSGRIEIFLVKYGVAPGALYLADVPKTESDLQKHTKVDEPMEIKGRPPVKESLKSESPERPAGSVTFPIAKPQEALSTTAAMSYLDAPTDTQSTPKTDAVSSPPNVESKGQLPSTMAKEDVARPNESSGSATVTQLSAPPSEDVALLKQPVSPVIGSSFNLKMNIIGQRKEADGNYIEVFVNEGSVLRSRDNFQVHLEASRPAYVYILIYDSEGKASQLFPDPKIEEPGFVQAGQNLVVPGQDSWFWLDDSTGTETIYVLASENPMTDIRALLAKMETADDTGQKRAAQAIKERIAAMQRGVGGITKGQSVTYTLSDGKKIPKVTDVVQGTGSVVRAVSFQHR